MSATPPYLNDPLRWVAAEVRYPRIDDFANGAPLALREAIQARFPVREPQQQQTIPLQILAGAGGPSAAPMQPPMIQTLDRFFTRDRLVSVVLGTDVIVLETTRYAGWHDLRDSLLHSLGALQRAQRPDGLLRLGLRYIDEIRVAQPIETLADWAQWISPNLVAPLMLDDGVLPSQGTVLLQYGTTPGFVTVLRAGPSATGRAVQEGGPLRLPFETPDGPYFLLDTDASWADPDRQIPEFDVERIAEIFDTLHEPCRRLFESSITQRLRDEVLNQPRTTDG